MSGAAPCPLSLPAPAASSLSPPHCRTPSHPATHRSAAPPHHRRLGLDVGQALSDPTSKRLLAACVGEAAAAFTAEGFTIDPKVSMYLKILRLPPHLFRCVRCLLPAPPPGFASSMNHDLVATDGRATEVGFLNGEVVEAGKRAGVPTPVTSAVLQVVTEMEQGKRPRRVLSSDEAVALFLGPTPYGSV